MQITLLNGYPDYVGKRFTLCGYGNGPASYSPVGDPVYFARYNNYIDILFPALTVSGIYEVKFIPSSYGPRATWSALWFYSGRQGVINVTGTGGTGMTPGTYPLVFTPTSGGTGAAGTITVLTATTYTITVTSAGSGYAGAPTVTAATGGTPPTLTALVALSAGAVPATSNLSSEVVQMGGFGGVY